MISPSSTDARVYRRGFGPWPQIGRSTEGTTATLAIQAWLTPRAATIIRCMAIGWERFGTRARKIALHECLSQAYVRRVWSVDELRRLDEFDGVLTSDELDTALRARSRLSGMTCHVAIDDPRILRVRCQSRDLVPRFQWRVEDMSLCPATLQAVAELRPVFDEDEVVRWFVEPNTWLSGECPARRLRSDPEAVRQAARADRYVARG